MGVEKLVVFYGIICAAMILFNCACIYYFKQRDQRTRHTSKRLTQQIHTQLEQLKQQGELRQEELDYLNRKLKNVGGLMSFNLALEELTAQDIAAAQQYLAAIRPVFCHLAQEYLKKEAAQEVYLLHLLAKYRICASDYDALAELMPVYARRPSIYCRYTALQVLCQTGRADHLVDTLYQIDRQGGYLPEKLLTTLLLGFEGESEALIAALLEQLSKFQPEMQVAFIGYIDRKSDAYGALFAGWLQQPQPDEVRYALLRYFWRHRYEPMRERLYALAKEQNAARWIEAASAVRALANYPGDTTIEVLKQALSSTNWYIRYNAAESLEKLGVTYNELSDIVNGGDRYAREMLTYRTEHKNLKEEVTAL